MPRLNSISGSLLSSSNSAGGSDGYGANLLGAIPQISTYDYRNFDISGDNLAVWKRGSDSMELHHGLIANAPGPTGVYTATDTLTTAGVNQDEQGWYQCVMNSDTIYVSYPFASSNRGSVNMVNYTNTGTIQGNATALSDQTSTGYETTNNFGYYKMHAIDRANTLWVQDGFTGHRIQCLVNKGTISPQGTDIFIATTTSVTRSTRGLGGMHIGDITFYTWGYVSGTQAHMSMFRTSINSLTGAADYVVSGEGPEVWRHTRMAYMTSVNGVDLQTPKLLVMGSGTSAGMQVREVANAATPSVSNFANFDGAQWSTDGGIACYNDIVVNNGIVYRWTDVDGTPDLVQIDDLLAQIPGITATRGLTRMNDQIIAMGTNSGRIHIFENVY
jgi:hypothetical protein